MAGEKPREPLRILGLWGVIPVSPWSAITGRAGVLWSNSSEKSSEEAATAEEVMENTQPFSWLSWLSPILITWYLPEPCSPLPCGWLTSHCWPWNHIPTGACLVSAITSSSHSIITRGRMPRKTTHHFLFLIPHCLIGWLLVLRLPDRLAWNVLI